MDPEELVMMLRRGEARIEYVDEEPQYNPRGRDARRWRVTVILGSAPVSVRSRYREADYSRQAQRALVNRALDDSEQGVFQSPARSNNTRHDLLPSYGRAVDSQTKARLRWLARSSIKDD